MSLGQLIDRIRGGSREGSQFPTLILESDGVRVQLADVEGEDMEEKINGNVLLLAIARKIRTNPEWVRELEDEFLAEVESSFLPDDL